MNKKITFGSYGFPKQGEIYKIYFSKKGQEIGKIRPSLVISNDVQNQYDEQIVVAPLTSEEEELTKERPFTVSVTKDKFNNLDKDSKILLHRIQTIDVELRLRDYVGYVNPMVVQQSLVALKVVFAMEE